jgi:hypothetical protein
MKLESYQAWEQAEQTTMHKTDFPETVNVFVGRKDAEDIAADASPHERYIISQNNALHANNKALAIEVTQLSSRVEELEDIEDRADSRASNLKGILKNFHEISKWQQEIGDKRRMVIDCMQQDLNAYTTRLKFHSRMLATLFFLLTMFSFEFCGGSAFALVTTCTLIIVPFQESSRLNLPVFSYSQLERRVHDLENEIVRANEANDYIHEFLDSR